MKKIVKTWCFHVAIAIDQLGNSIIGGFPDETISARCHREKRWQKYLIDYTLFFWQKDENGRRHCEQCYWYERERMDLPVEYRKTKKAEKYDTNKRIF
jgi:hypothetical protein